MKYCSFFIAVCVILVYPDILKLRETRQFPVKLLSLKSSITDSSIKVLTFKTKLKKEVRIDKEEIDFLIVGEQRYDFVYGQYFEDKNLVPLSILEIPSSEYKKGVYRNYREFFFNDPTFPQDSLVITKASPNGIDSDEFLLAKIKKRKKLIERKYKYKSDYWGYCDGERIYIKGPRYLSRLHFDSIGIWFWDLFPFQERGNLTFDYHIKLDTGVEIKEHQYPNAKWSWNDRTTYWDKNPCLLLIKEAENKIITAEVLKDIIPRHSAFINYKNFSDLRQGIALNRVFQQLMDENGKSSSIGNPNE